MKILMTGFSQRMVNSQKLRYDYISNCDMLKRSLALLDHQVEHRAVEHGESLTDFDLALVGIGPPRSFTARHIIGASWAAATAKKVIFFCDDWSIVNMGSSIKTTLKNFDKYRSWFTESLGQSMDDVEADSVKAMLQNMYYLAPNFKLIAPMFPWGRHKALLEDNLSEVKLIPWDPTTMVRDLPMSVVPAAEKKKQWICATLQNHDAWVEEQRCTWPVQWMGNRRKGEEYRPEAEVLQEYANSWGVLCPKYNRAGNGWCRLRYMFAAKANAILRCDIKDSCYMGEAYRLTLSSIEQRDVPELDGVAKAQADWFYQNVTPKKDMLEKLQEALKED